MYQLSDNLLLMLRTCTDLPSPPAIASKIIELSSNDTSSLSDVADVVSVDPALSAKLLRMANSPLYTKQRKIENLRQAITLFGLDGTLNIALSFSLRQSTTSDNDSGLNYNNYWKRSLASAMICQDIIQRIGSVSKDSAFLAGLLQDIGMLALDKAKPELYKGLGVNQAMHEIICAQEQNALESDHSQVGAWLLEEWHLPENLLEPICKSHAGIYDDEPCPDPLSKAVACSSLLADIFITDEENIKSLLPRSISKANKLIKLSSKEYKEIIETASNNYSDFAQMFDIELENSRMLEFIGEQAKEVLMLRNLNKIKETESLQEAAEQLRTKADKLEELNRRDSLTKLFNRRHFDEAIKVEFKNATKYQWPLGLIFIDLDFFKKINDTLGHDAGDDVLCSAASILLECTRTSDIVARYGGEEFTIILPGTGHEGVEITCDRINNAFRNKAITLRSGDIVHVTVSAGAIVYNGDNQKIKDWDELIRLADKATYQSKDNGRNQYCIVDETLPASDEKLAG